MPIKFQALGGGGGNQLQIATDAGAKVELTLGKVTYTKTANESGIALFSRLKAGVWTVTISRLGVTHSEKVEIQDEYGISYPLAIKAKDLPLREKVKIGGHKFMVMCKNHTGYPENSVTLIQIGELVSKKWSSSNYSDGRRYTSSEIRTYIQGLYNGLDSKTKEIILETTLKTRNYDNGQTYETKDFFFIPSVVEVCYPGEKNDYIYPEEGAGIGFTSSAERHIEINNSDSWWLRTEYNNPNGNWSVTQASNFSGDPYIAYNRITSSTTEVRMVCNIKDSAVFLLKRDSEGFLTLP